MLQQHQAQQFGIVPQLLQDLSTVPYPQWQPPLPAQQQQLSQHCALACAASSTAEGSEGYAPIPSSESSAIQSPSVQLSSAHQHSTPTAGQLRARAPQANISASGAAAALRSVQSSPLKQHARNRSRSSSGAELLGGSRIRGSSSAGSTSTGEALKEVLRQALMRRQYQPAAVPSAPAPSEDGSVRQRLLAALGAATAQRVSTHPQQQPASPSAIATAGQLLELVADQVSPLVAASMRQRILQELQAIEEDAAAAGVPLDLESETQHILPQLQEAAATAVRMKQQAAAAAATSSGGAGTALLAAAVPSQSVPAGTRAISTPPCFSNMQPQLNNSSAGAATAAGPASASLGSVEPVTRSNSDAQLAALLESALSAAAGRASPAASSYSPAVASAPMAAPNMAPGALLPGAHAMQPVRSPGRAASPEVLTQLPAGSMMQMLLSEADLDADQLRGSNKRQRVGPGRSCSSGMMTHSLTQQDLSRHPSPGVSPSAFPAAAVGSSGLSCGPVQPSAANSTWLPSPQRLTGSLGGWAGVQEVGGSNPAAGAALTCLDIEQLLQDEATAAMLEHLGGDLM